MIICGTDNPHIDSDGLIYIGYTDLVDGYRHAYRVTLKTGRVQVKHARSNRHPADRGCPGCAEERREATA
jgi:hypothetical protein